ncbi:hypothetical protein Taro_055139, partial [Colocasia esculenta]|nr:hypothetical protein [Colocasia esculenta]
MAASSSSSWSCSRCTFLNPPSQKSACQLCLSPHSPSAAAAAPPSSSPLKWSCRACTFHNTTVSVFCEMCGTRSTSISSSALVLGDDDSFSDIDEVEAAVGPPVGSVFQPLRRCSDGRGLKAEPSSCRDELEECRRPGKVARKETDPVPSGSNSNFYKVLSYNVWFREDLELNKRIKALGDLLQQHSPDLICFQEVTPNIYRIFQGSSWWKSYQCSVPPEMAAERAYFCMQMSRLPVKEFRRKPFGNSIMARELCIADIVVMTGKTLVIATSHLESPCPAPPKWDQMYSKERVAQAKESLQLLNKSQNVIFCGDMNWDDKLDGAFPLPTGWVDVWMELRPKENGWTYDT